MRGALKRSSAVLLGVLPVVGGCLGPGALRPLAPDQGTEVRYAVSVDTLLAALPSALAGRRLGLAFREPFDSTTTMFLAIRGNDLFTYGELVRVLVHPVPPDGLASARFEARSRFALDASGLVDRVVPRLIEAVDDSLGAAALGPFPGMRARGRTGQGSGQWVRGTVIAGPDGVLGLTPDRGATGPPVPLAELRDAAVFRGSYSHRFEGANIGSLAGFVAGGIIGASTSDRSFRLSDVLSEMAIGSIVGLLAGSVVGALIRTEVWSEVAPRQVSDEVRMVFSRPSRSSRPCACETEGLRAATRGA